MKMKNEKVWTLIKLIPVRSSAYEVTKIFLSIKQDITF